MKKLIVTLCLFCSTFMFAQSWWNAKKIKGNGKVITETRSVGNFDDVSLSGFFDVVLIDGKEGKITIEGEENLLPYIITEVEDETLQIKVKKNTNLKTYKKLVVTVPFETINGLSLGGSGTMISKKIISGNEVHFAIGGSGNIKTEVKAQTIKSSIGGSGSIYLKGNSDELKCSIAGSGNIKAYDLQVNNLKVSVAGSGDVYATANERIKASIAGSGSVYYKGDAKYVDTNAIGSGDVHKRD